MYFSSLRISFSDKVRERALALLGYLLDNDALARCICWIAIRAAVSGSLWTKVRNAVSAPRIEVGVW